MLGAAGGIGQPLSLLLKACPLIDELALYDVVNSPGVAADLSHISSKAVRHLALHSYEFYAEYIRKSPGISLRMMV